MSTYPEAKPKSEIPSVSLGCGTLIFIAIIVSLFSRPDTDKLESKISRLQDSVEKMRQSVSAQTREIQQLRYRIEEHREDGDRQDE